MKNPIIYTLTDEAPALATRSLLPVVRAFAGKAGIPVETRDISLAGRILAAFPETLSEEQRIPDALGELGELVMQPETNIIKLPNISASIPQLKAAVAELQALGYKLPEYPEEPSTDSEKEIKSRYDKIKGSAVNPVLREGNSDRRAPGAVKAFARNNPHSMGSWSRDSKSTVISMEEGDFYDSEKSLTLSSETTARIELVREKGDTVILKESLPLLKDEIIDAAVLSRRALRSYYRKAMDMARDKGLLLSLHLKATMMKVSDPIIFGHALSVYFAPLFEKYAVPLQEAGVDPNNGLGDLYKKIESLSPELRSEIKSEIKSCLADGPDPAMVDSDKGITNFHVPSDVIIDASMPACIRSSGKMWNPAGKLQDTLALIPDRCYAGVYRESMDYCREHGAFDPATMGSVANVGLMAQKAEEYGSHDKTFEIPADGIVRAVDSGGNVLLEQPVEEGDIFRMCQVKDAPVRDWVKLAVTRGRLTGQKVVFWLDDNRAHDRELINKVNAYLPGEDTEGLDIRILDPVAATRFSMDEIRAGRDLISVTGNVLRDYLTDLFPILELGTSAKMLSVVPLMRGGGLFETGAGGSAPKHVQQFLSENHLRWDSLGEFLALAVSLEQVARKEGNKKAGVLAKTLDEATALFLENRKGPSRKAGERDNRGSHFYLTLYWARALADQKDDSELSAVFTSLADALEERADVIDRELLDVQGTAVDLGGYYRPDEEKMTRAMRPSSVFNGLIDIF